MTTAELLALIVGVIIPGLTALITREHASAKVKALLSALLAAVGGTLAGFTVNAPHGTAEWRQIVATIALAWLSAGVAYWTGWKPSGASAAIARATAGFGLGPPTTPAPGVPPLPPLIPPMPPVVQPPA